MRRWCAAMMSWRCVSASRCAGARVAAVCALPHTTARRSRVDAAGGGGDAHDGDALTAAAATRAGDDRASRSAATIDAAERVVDDDHNNNDDDEADGFDELEAASQEVHDVCMAMLVYVRRAATDRVAGLPSYGRHRRLRECVPLRARTLVHGHRAANDSRDREYAVGDGFDSPAQRREATQQFLQLGNKLLLLLQSPLMTRLLRSAAKQRGDNRCTGVYARHKVLDKAHWRAFASYARYTHAPFELTQLRADMCEDVVRNARSRRDAATLRRLFALLRPQHTFRAQLEQRLHDILCSGDSSDRDSSDATTRGT